MQMSRAANDKRFIVTYQKTKKDLQSQQEAPAEISRAANDKRFIVTYQKRK